MTKKQQKIILIGIFVILQLIGLFIADDFGESYDEDNHYRYGEQTFENYKLKLSSEEASSDDSAQEIALFADRYRDTDVGWRWWRVETKADRRASTKRYPDWGIVEYKKGRMP